MASGEEALEPELLLERASGPRGTGMEAWPAGDVDEDGAGAPDTRFETVLFDAVPRAASPQEFRQLRGWTAAGAPPVPAGPDLDARQSPALARALPGLDGALDLEVAARHLQGLLTSEWDLESCRVDRFASPSGTRLRYRLHLRGRRSGEVAERFVAGRLFQAAEQAEGMPRSWLRGRAGGGGDPARLRPARRGRRAAAPRPARLPRGRRAARPGRGRRTRSDGSAARAGPAERPPRSRAAGLPTGGGEVRRGRPLRPAVRAALAGLAQPPDGAPGRLRQGLPRRPGRAPAPDPRGPARPPPGRTRVVGAVPAAPVPDLPARAAPGRPRGPSRNPRRPGAGAGLDCRWPAWRPRSSAGLRHGRGRVGDLRADRGIPAHVGPALARAPRHGGQPGQGQDLATELDRVRADIESLRPYAPGSRQPCAAARRPSPRQPSGNRFRSSSPTATSPPRKSSSTARSAASSTWTRRASPSRRSTSDTSSHTSRWSPPGVGEGRAQAGGPRWRPAAPVPQRVPPGASGPGPRRRAGQGLRLPGAHRARGRRAQLAPAEAGAAGAGDVTARESTAGASSGVHLGVG